MLRDNLKTEKPDVLRSVPAVLPVNLSEKQVLFLKDLSVAGKNGAKLFNMECSNILTDGFLKPTKQLAKPDSILRPFSAHLVVSYRSLT